MAVTLFTVHERYKIYMLILDLAESGHKDICGGSIADSFNLFLTFVMVIWNFDEQIFCSTRYWPFLFGRSLILDVPVPVYCTWQCLTEWSLNNTFFYKCFLAARKQFSNFWEIDLLWNTHKILRMPTAGVERQDSFKSVLKDVKRKLSTTQRKNSKQENTKSNGGSPFSSLKSTPFSSNQASPNRSPFTTPK